MIGFLLAVVGIVVVTVWSPPLALLIIFVALVTLDRPSRRP